MSPNKDVHFLDALGPALFNVSKHLFSIYRNSLRLLPSLSRTFWLNFALGFLLVIAWSVRGTHLWFLHRIWPSAFTYSFVLHHLVGYKIFNHLFWLSIFYVASVLFGLGLVAVARFKKYENAFIKAGIKNSIGQYPKVIDFTKMSDFRSKVRVLIDGIDFHEFETKGTILESSIDAIIENVARGKDPRFVDLYVTKRLIPRILYYRDVRHLLTTPYTFVVGESLAEIELQDICSLPHILAAGATGTGKSSFEKQLIMGLLDGSSAIQIYLLDLKRGLEMKDFTLCPNVTMVKEVSDAVVLLRQIREEMDRRFEYLEQAGFNRLDPDRDNRDRIVVCIDEASVLYTESKVNADEKKLAQEATEITDNIAKLSRAAGIHLIFATQKVTKETISTHIQENLEGRMCFEVNSLQGSNIVLGNGAAKSLPHIAGRGIWKVGARTMEVQTPFIDKDEIIERCNAIAEEFKSGKRALKQPMFSPQVATQESSKAVTEFIEGKMPTEK